MSDIVFYANLLLVNFICFLPMYCLNYRQQPNPLAFLIEKRFRNQNKIKLLYSKLHFTDPFRLNLDFTLAVLLLVAIDAPQDVFVIITSVILATTMVFLIYIAVMLFVFDRPPAFTSDLSLIRSGLVIAKKRRELIALLIALILLIIAAGAFWISHQLYLLSPSNQMVPLSLMALLLIPGLYHWKSYDYAYFHARTAYSCLLHAIRNVTFSRRFNRLFEHGSDYFEQFNYYKAVEFASKPNFVFVCVESYGAVCHKEENLIDGLAANLSEQQDKLDAAGFFIASTYSTSPILSGGSWLSYSSFMYGTRIDDLQLYDGLFQVNDGFSAYESMFHVLRRNGYCNSLICPMGGVNNNDVNWKSINRCFQSDLNIDWQTLDYRGQTFPFFTQKHTFCAPDQFALNFGYDHTQSTTDGPFSLFYCTMNSHIPWQSPTTLAQDWRKLNDPDITIPSTSLSRGSAQSRYQDSINYQLAFVLDFALQHKNDDMVLVIFGDHQPPLITTPEQGTDTPIHVITQNAALHQQLVGHGFSSGLSLTEHRSNIKHEGFLSLFLTSCNRAFGREPHIKLPVNPDGIPLTNEIVS